jgi:hypothetical protein
MHASFCIHHDLFHMKFNIASAYILNRNIRKVISAQGKKERNWRNIREVISARGEGNN